MVVIIPLGGFVVYQMRYNLESALNIYDIRIRIIIAQKEYKGRHDWVGKVIHRVRCKIFKFEHTNKWYMHNPAAVLKNDTHKLLWDFDTQTDPLISGVGCPRGVMVKAMDCRIVVREFVLQSRYYIHFRANTLGKGMNPLILPAMG